MPTMPLDALRQVRPYGNAPADSETDDRISGEFSHSDVHPIPPVADYYSKASPALLQFSVLSCANAARLFGGPRDGIRVRTPERAKVQGLYAAYEQAINLYKETSGSEPSADPARQISAKLEQFGHLYDATRAIYEAAGKIAFIKLARGDVGELQFLRSTQRDWYAQAQALSDVAFDEAVALREQLPAVSHLVTEEQMQDFEDREMYLFELPSMIVGRQESVEKDLDRIGKSDAASYEGPRQLPPVVVDADDFGAVAEPETAVVDGAEAVYPAETEVAPDSGTYALSGALIAVGVR